MRIPLPPLAAAALLAVGCMKEPTAVPPAPSNAPAAARQLTLTYFTMAG